MNDQENRTEKTWRPLTTYAARLADRDGWVVDEAPFPLAEIERRIRALGHPLLEIRLISEGLTCESPSDWEPSGVGAMLALDEGWAYDGLADCWRAPGEPVTQLPGDPVAVERFEVSMGTPHYGWLPIDLVACARVAHIHASYVFDPLPELVTWLEGLADGECPRISIDEEGKHHNLLTFEAEDPLVRLVVVHLAESDEIEMDVLVSRVVLVGVWCTALRGLSQNPQFDEHWGRETGYRACDLLSARLQNYLRTIGWD